jgi:hypothetical protein
MTSQEDEPKLGAESFSCPHCNAVAHQDWYSLFLKPENATEVVVLTLEALMLAKGNETDQFLQRLKDNVLAYEYQEHPRNLKVKLLNLHVRPRLARGPALKNLSRPKVEWGLICSPAH